MKQLPYITVFEHETLVTHENAEGKFITRDQLEMLYGLNDKHGGKYFSPTRNGIKFSQYVGVIQIGRTTIEILPKTDQGNDTRKWHNILLQMLAACRMIKRESISQASLRKRENSLLELYIEMYLHEVEKLLQSGFTKKYIRVRQQTTALKGKLLFSQHIRQNLIHRERFFTEHTIYTQNNIYNQVLKRGLAVVKYLGSRSDLNDRASSLLLHFQSVSDVKISNNDFEKIVFTRNTKRYQEALYIAKLLILNFSPDIKSGTDDLLAILFDMNQLWQEYVLLQLKKSAPDDVSVRKGSKPFWEKQPINPDIVVETSSGFHILDTKWKVLDQSKPTASDLKQMFAYNIYWDCKKSVLLYPRSYSSPDNFYGAFYQGMDESHGCSICFVDIADEHGNLKTLCLDDVLRSI